MYVRVCVLVLCVKVWCVVYVMSVDTLSLVILQLQLCPQWNRECYDLQES